MRSVLIVVLLLCTACAPLPLQQESLRDAYLNVEQCESRATTATGLYRAGISEGRTWLEIKNDCLSKR